MESIEKSVGAGGSNLPIDVIKLQNLLNNSDLYTGLSAPLPLSGLVDAAMIAAIKSFQSKHPQLKMANPDGRVDPGGATLAQLNGTQNSSKPYQSYLPANFANNPLNQIDLDGFLSLYTKQYPSPALSSNSQQALRGLLASIIKDSPGIDLRWAAYMLATVKHECANTWLPIEEYGKGKNLKYGVTVNVTGPNGETLSNVYYGRGYVQLTWDYNYQKMDTALGLTGKSNSMYWYPQNALVPDIAYQIMSYGMQRGSFTGKKLQDYISGANCDYVNARRIINGTDQASVIAAYANNIEYLLRFFHA